MPRIFKCQTCGLDKTLESRKKDGTTFMSCPNWKDEEHRKAREDWKAKQGSPVTTGNWADRPSTSSQPVKVSVDVIGILADNFEALRQDFNERMDNQGACLSKEIKIIKDGQNEILSMIKKLSVLDQE